ncbi:MAG: EAL domain-containing protein [Pseudomonadota bacterium]
MKSLGTRLAIIVSSVLLALMVVIGFWLDNAFMRSIQQDEIEQAKLHAKTLLGSLKTLMLNGSGTLAHEWLKRLQGVAGIEEIQVLRRDGSEAFSDLRTVSAVNGYLGYPRFFRQPVASTERAPIAPELLQDAWNGSTLVDTTKSGLVSVVMPIASDVECLTCHGYDQTPYRGLLHLAIQTASQSRVESMRRNLWSSAAVLAVVLAVILLVSLRYSVLRPIAQLRSAITSVARGNRTFLMVHRRDEIGAVAAVFNQMQEDLRLSESRARAVMENVADGIITFRAEGAIDTINAAAQRMFGYSLEELRGQQVNTLMPEPFRSGRNPFLMEAEAESKQILPVLHEVFGRRKNGTVFPMEVAVTLMVLGDETYYIAILRDITSRKAQTAALRYQAMHDSLTDLPNRNLLHDRLQQAIRVALRDRRTLALIIMDLNRFKEVNDTLGHQVGDKLLQQVAQRLRLILRESDTIARLGGDEFAILLPGADSGQAISTSGKIVSTFDQPFVVEGQRLHIGASLGITLFPQHGDDAVVLMQRADVAMYVAKRAGKHYAFYNPEEDQHSLRQLAIIGELRTAIEKNELVLHYQPAIDLRTRSVSGIEVLVRWQHANHGLLMPEEFVSLAEQTGLIRVLSSWVLRNALQECRGLLADNPDFQLSVNISMRNINDEEFFDDVAKILRRDNVSPAQLCFEITETAIMEDPEAAIRALLRLHELGIHFAIDDFGTGYSSLAYLRQLPVDDLKIDQTFVNSLVADDNSAVIVRSTVDLAHKLGKRVTAEGVVSEEAVRMLTQLECDAAQGHFFAAPMPFDDLQVWLMDQRIMVKTA